MAFATISGITLWNSGANATSHVVDLPTGHVIGERIIIIFSKDGTGQPTGFPSEFTVVQSANISSAFAITILSRVIDGSEPWYGSGTPTVTITTSVGEGTCAVSFKTNAPDVEYGGAAQSSTAGVPDPGSLTASWGAGDNTFMAVGMHDIGSTSVTGYPTNYTGNQSYSSWANSQGTGIGIATRQVTGDTEDPGAFSLSANRAWCARTLVFKETATAFSATAAPVVGGVEVAASATLTIPDRAIIAAGIQVGSAPTASGGTTIPSGGNDVGYTGFGVYNPNTTVLAAGTTAGTSRPAALRFVDPTLFASLAGKTVTWATLCFKGEVNSSTPRLTVRAEYSDDATQITLESDLDVRAHANAGVGMLWQTPATVSGDIVLSTNLAPEINKVIKRPGFAANAIQLFLVGETDGTAWRFLTYDNNPANAPQLLLQWRDDPTWDISIAASSTPPNFAATAALVSSGTDAVLAASFSEAANYESTLTATTGGVETVIAATSAVPQFSSTITASLGGVEAAATTTSSVPTFSSTLTATTGGVDSALTATSTVPSFAATITAETGGVNSAVIVGFAFGVTLTAGVSTGNGEGLSGVLAAGVELIAGVGSGTGEGLLATATIRAAIALTAGIGAGTGDSTAASLAAGLELTAGVSTGNGEGLAANLTIGGAVLVSAGTGDGVGDRLSVQSGIGTQLTIGVGDATGEGLAAASTIGIFLVPASASDGTGDSLSNTVKHGHKLTAGISTGNGEGLPATITVSDVVPVQVVAGISTGTGEGLLAGPVSLGRQLTAGISTGNGEGLLASVNFGPLTPQPYFGVAGLGLGAGEGLLGSFRNFPFETSIEDMEVTISWLVQPIGLSIKSVIREPKLGVDGYVNSFLVCVLPPVNLTVNICPVIVNPELNT